jgi:hypothetical protein
MAIPSLVAPSVLLKDSCQKELEEDFELTHEIVQFYNFRSRNVIVWGKNGEVTHIETVFKPEGIAENVRLLPRRPFTMPCRPVCGLDLRRVHLTCLTCNIRRAYYGMIPTRRRIIPHVLLMRPTGQGPREHLRYVLYKLSVTIAEFFAD